METYAGAPRRVTRRIASGSPRLSGGVEQVLCAEDVSHEEKLRVFDATIHMALGGEVDDAVDGVLLKEAFHKCAIADIAFDEMATQSVDVAFDRVHVAGIGEEVEDDQLRVRVGGQHILHEVGANESGSAGD